MRAVEQSETIVRALRRDDRTEEEARAFLAEHDAGVRADALAEGAALLRRQAGRKIGRPVHNSGLRTGAILLERAADRPAPETDTEDAPAFFQPGHTYTDGNGYRAPELVTYFLVEHVTRHPDRGHLRAIGWMRNGAPGEGWHGDFRDEGEFDGWSDVTGEVTP